MSVSVVHSSRNNFLNKDIHISVTRNTEVLPLLFYLSVLTYTNHAWQQSLNWYYILVLYMFLFTYRYIFKIVYL